MECVESHYCTVVVHYCKECKAIVFGNADKLTKFCVVFTRLNSMGEIDVENIHVTLDDESPNNRPECLACYTEIEVSLDVPLDVYQRLYAVRDNDLFYVDLGDDVEGLLFDEVREKITLALMVNV